MRDYRGERRFDPLDPYFIKRELSISSWLRVRERLAAWSGGHRDGRFDVLGIADPDRTLSSPDGMGVDTFWLGRTRAAFGQADQRSFLEMEARVAKPRQDLSRLVRDFARLTASRGELVARISALTARPKPDANSVVAGPAEQNAAVAVVVARRLRGWTVPLAAAEAELVAIDSRLAAIAEQASELYGIVTVAFDAAISRSNAIRNYYERRCDVYRRALTHSSPNGSRIQAAGAGTLAIPAPAWITGSCPWVPADYRTTITEDSNV